MSTCGNWVTTAEIECKNAGSALSYVCTTWAEVSSQQCTQWADQGSNVCATAWQRCHWYTPWNCIAGFFCSAFVWVAKWVCLGWVNLVNLICQVSAWIEVHVFCGLIVWPVVLFPLSLLCEGLTQIRCAVFSLNDWFRGLFGDDRARPRIEHVFVLMLENRSFDHMLGFSDRHVSVDPFGQPTPFNEGFPQYSNTNNINPRDNHAVPTNTPAEYFLNGRDLDPPHEFDPTLTALCGENSDKYDPNTGIYPDAYINNSGFVLNYSHAQDPTRVLKCFDPFQLPVLNQLAREFAVCDHWFSSMPGPTEPNRLFAMAASSGGLDDSPCVEWLQFAVATGFDGYEFENGNIFDALEANCNDWRIVAGDSFPFSFILKGMNMYRASGHIQDFDDFASDIKESDFRDQFVWIEPKYGAHSFDILGPGDYVCGSSMHPLDDVTRGEQLIKTVYETIRNSPHWERSLLIITFDEHGGFYDHVKPGSAVPPGDIETATYHQTGFKFGTLGVRVPALVISPYTRAGTVDHTVYDHSSILATAERLFGIDPLTDRDKAAKTVLQLLPLNSPRTDTPATLHRVALPDPRLVCEVDDASTPDRLLIQRSELRIARETGMYRDRQTRSYSVPRSQVPFLGMALRRALEGVEYADRLQWLKDFQAIRTGVDAALFMTEAKLKIEHGIDMKKASREAELEKRRAVRAH